MPVIRPFRCFNSRVALIALVVATAVIVLGWWGRNQPVGSPQRILAAFGQVAGFLWILFEIVGAVRTLDELERRIHAEALAFSATAIVFVSGSWYFLHKAGLPAVNWAEYSLAMLSLLWSASVFWIYRRYR